MKLLNKPILLIALVISVFFYKGIIKGQIAAPLDVIVGIYNPFRDHIWNGLVAGVPFKNSLLSDVVSIIIPWRELGISQILNGIAPLWNPYSASGSPLAANFQSSVFYPLNIVFLLLNFLTAWNIYIFLVPFLSAIFSYLFLRQKKVGTYGAVFGALIFSFSGFMMTWLEYGVVGHAFLWLPLMLYASDKVINDAKLKYLPLLSFSIFMSLLAGYPQMSVYCLLALALFIFFALLIDVKTISKKISLLVLFGIFSLLGIALSGIQLIPGMELLENSIRGVDPVVSSLNYGFFPPQNFLTIFAPDIFGNPTTGNYFGKFSYNDTAFYLGILPLVLALLAPVFQKNRGVRFFLMLSGLSFLLAIENPVSKLVYSLQIPGLSGGIASRSLSLFDFSIAMLSGYGFDNLIKNKNSKGILKKVFLIILVISFAFASVWFMVLSKNTLFNDVSKRNLILPSAVFIASIFLVFIFLKLKSYGKLSKIILLSLITLVSFELVRQGLKYNPFSPKDYYYPKTEVTEFLKDKAVFERVSGTIPTNMTIPYRFYSPESYDALLLKRYSEFLGILNNKRPIAGSRYGEIFNYRSNLTNLLGVKYIISEEVDYKTNLKPDSIDFPNERFKKAFSYGKTSVYKNLEAFPRAYLVNNFIVEKDAVKISDLLISPDFDLRTTIILEETPKMIPSNNPAKSSATIITYKPNLIKIKTSSSENTLLFLSDNFYPGWKATIDGKVVDILRADYTFRAVEVPVGEHEVNFEYNPNSFRIGIVLTAVSGVLIFLSLIILRKK